MSPKSTPTDPGRVTVDEIVYLNDYDREIRIGKLRLRHDDPVRILVAEQWYEGQIALQWIAPCVWVDELGCVDFEHISELAPPSTKVQR